MQAGIDFTLNNLRDNPGAVKQVRHLTLFFYDFLFCFNGFCWVCCDLLRIVEQKMLFFWVYFSVAYTLLFILSCDLFTFCCLAKTCWSWT